MSYGKKGIHDIMKKDKDTNEVINQAEGGTATKKLGMVKKQKVMIISFACVALVLAILYFAVFLPIMNKKNEEANALEPPPELIEGEAYDSTGNYMLMFPHMPKKDIKSIEIHNSYGSYTLKRTKESDDDSFYIEEHPQAPIGAEAFTALVVDSGYTVVNRRVVEKCEDMSVYGLADSDNPAYYIITNKDNVSYKVFVGNRIPSSGGFYARVDGRDAVYVLSSTVYDTVLAPATALVTPLLGVQLPQNKYQETDEVILSKNGEPFVYIKYTMTNIDEFALSAYEMLYPANYIVNDDNFSGKLLYSLVALSGSSVMEIGSPDNYLRNNEALMAKYGFYDIHNMPYELYYKYGDSTTAIAFAPAGADGYYFAYSYLYDMIVLISGDTVPYLEWDLLDYVNSALFAEYINDVSEITVSGSLKKDGKIYPIDEKFSIKLKGEGSSTNLECYAFTTGKTFTGMRPAMNPIQAFYGTVLAMKMQGYIKTEGIDVSTLSEYASLKIKMVSGDETVYKFYRYSERCYYTVNGEGEFYMALRDVNKLLIDSVRAAYGMSVDTGEEYPELPGFFKDKFS